MKLTHVGSVDFLGLPLTLRTFAGVVQEKATRSESHLRTSRNGYGVLSGASLITDQHQDIWLKGDDGEEVRLSIGGVAIPMRNGHRLQAFFAGRGPETGPLVAIKNLNTGELFETFNKYQQLPNPGFFKLSLLNSLGVMGLALFGVIATFVLDGILYAVGIKFGIGLAGTAIGIWLFMQHNRAKDRVIKFRNELNRAVVAAM